MTEDTTNSSAAAEYLAHAADVLKENEGFIRANAKGTYEEVMALINDAINEIGLAVKKPEREKNYVEHSTAFFAHHILMPFSYAIYLDLLAGNTPACFMELRLLLESLAKCYLADSRYPEAPFFQTKLELLELEMEQTNLSISKAMKELGKKMGVKGEFVTLWGKLSRDWIHTRGFTDKLVSYVTEKSDMPPWALTIPMKYTENDLNILEELGNRISQFRSLLVATMKQSRQAPGVDQK